MDPKEVDSDTSEGVSMVATPVIPEEEEAGRYSFVSHQQVRQSVFQTTLL